MAVLASFGTIIDQVDIQSLPVLIPILTVHSMTRSPDAKAMAGIATETRDPGIFLDKAGAIKLIAGITVA